MKQWEYSDVVIRKDMLHETLEALNLAGSEGWESTGIVEENHHYKMYLMKREVDTTPSPAKVSVDVKHSHSIRRRCSGYSRCPMLGTPHEILESTY